MNRKILRLAIPNIVSNVTIPLLGLVDLALMGHLDSEVFIGAVSLGTVIFNFIYWGFSFLRMGTSGFTAQAYGEKKEAESYHILSRAMLISTAISLVIISLQFPIEWLSFRLINGSQEVEALAREYFRIRIWAAPATLGLYVLNGWFLGMQNARYPMITSIAANVFNIVLSFSFVKLFHLNSAGVALGTVLAQYLGVVIGVYLFFRSYKSLTQHWNWKAIINPATLKSFFKVNSDIFIRTFCVIFVFTFFTSKSASINDHILAVNSILIQFLLFFAFFIDGFAYAGEALAGRFVGERSRLLFKKVTRSLFYWGSLLALAFSFLYLVANKLILSILTNQQELIQSALDFRWWIVVTPVLSFASFIWDGIYIGATASREMRNSMLGATLLVFLPGYFLMQPIIGNHALWVAMLLFMLSRGIFQTFLFPKVLQKTFPAS
ncbi:MATE family efflux transporter [Sunxiuqinia elliptica]|uniref:MATE family multidrug resistance protein n=1 Tax=Sunxiuqinia elliptica TaxID=655355 RepID=A0A4R6H9Y7_9BACT|nr:MATE family efflux transporter [Sunxiuqinia elliptica]TDO04797.1 MATE family multidrug resistance protein [Sunxiuqinia elliptica]TDO64344.1 MATE family multidrug resistance protein [Sunxiuqinia elliptica]